MHRLNLPVIHPFLFAAHPVLFLYSRNMSEVSFRQVLEPLVVALVAALALYRLLGLALKDKAKSGIIASIAALMFFLYAPVFERLVHGMVVHGLVVGRHRVFLPVWGVAFVLLGVSIARTRRSLGGATRYLNAFGSMLVAITLCSIFVYEGRALGRTAGSRSWSDVLERRLEAERLQPPPGKPLRDVYYIILDEHCSSRTLRAYYGHDNSTFTGNLRRKGFYIADESRSNYLATYPSLASSLNLDHIEALSHQVGGAPIDLSQVGAMIRNNRVCRLLKAAGYTFVFVPSRYQVTCRNPFADVHVSADRIGLGEFARILIYNSVLQAFYSAPHAHRANMLYVLRELKGVSAIKGPKLVFAHILCPHEPYVFDAKGNLPRRSLLEQATPTNVSDLYRGQVAFIDRCIEEVVDGILCNSTVAPIIILQGDHGPRLVSSRKNASGDAVLHVRSSILNAYYLPDGGDRLLYTSISPVNSFRVVFNLYFGTSYKLLPDTTYNVNLSPTQPCTKFDIVERGR